MPTGETWHVDGVSVIGVPFCGLKGINAKIMEIIDTKPNQCKIY